MSDRKDTVQDIVLHLFRTLPREPRKALMVKLIETCAELMKDEDYEAARKEDRAVRFKQAQWPRNAP